MRWKEGRKRCQKIAKNVGSIIEALRRPELEEMWFIMFCKANEGELMRRGSEAVSGDMLYVRHQLPSETRTISCVIMCGLVARLAAVRVRASVSVAYVWCERKGSSDRSEKCVRHVNCLSR